MSDVPFCVYNSCQQPGPDDDEHMFHEIPKIRPDTPLLDQVDHPEQLREFDESLLPQLARELRAFLLYSVGQTGGHFGAGLGVVELTIALHYLFDTPEDRLVWDVGHQAYPHKILTGRRDNMDSLRQKEGLAAFPKRMKVSLIPLALAIQARLLVPLSVWPLLLGQKTSVVVRLRL